MQTIYRSPMGGFWKSVMPRLQECLATKVEMEILGSCVPSCPTDPRGSDTERVSGDKIHKQRPCERLRHADLTGNNSGSRA